MDSTASRLVSGTGIQLSPLQTVRSARGLWMGTRLLLLLLPGRTGISAGFFLAAPLLLLLPLFCEAVVNVSDVPECRSTIAGTFFDHFTLILADLFRLTPVAAPPFPPPLDRDWVEDRKLLLALAAGVRRRTEVWVGTAGADDVFSKRQLSLLTIFRPVEEDISHNRTHTHARALARQPH